MSRVVDQEKRNTEQLLTVFSFDFTNKTSSQKCLQIVRLVGRISKHTLRDKVKITSVILITLKVTNEQFLLTMPKY